MSVSVVLYIQNWIQMDFAWLVGLEDVKEIMTDQICAKCGIKFLTENGLRVHCVFGNCLGHKKEEY